MIRSEYWITGLKMREMKIPVDNIEEALKKSD